jgi:hypothetical protein
MGGGKGGSSSSTVSIPPEVLARYNEVNALAKKVATTPFTPYSTDPNAFVAPLTSTQQAGIANINALQGMATPDVKEGQSYQRQAIDTAKQAQAQALGIDTAALQGISQAQAQGTAYNQAAGQNIFNAMGSAAPYMNQMGQLTQAGLQQGQGYLQGATGLTANAINVGNQYAQQAQPFYYGAMGAAQPLNQQAVNLTGMGLAAAQPLNQQAINYMGQGAQNLYAQPLDYSQYMNPYTQNVLQAQQALQQEQDAQQRSALQGQAIAAGAFGGDRAGIAQANLARQQSLANQAVNAGLLQSGFNQAQAAAQQQQGVNLTAAQANRAAQQQAAQQAAALGQQQYAQALGAGQQFGTFGQQQYGQQLGLGQAISALGQQQYLQNLGTGSQLGTLGQQGFGQNLQAGAQLGNLGQQLYAQNIGQGQAIQGLGNQQFTQGLQGSQAAAGIGQNIYGMGSNLAGLQQTSGMNIGNLGLQNQAAQIAAAQAQMGAGQIQQQTDQAGKTALYNQFLQQQGYPFQLAQFQAGIAEGTGALSGSTTNTTRTGYRGGRMNQYASGGLIPDSMGGAVMPDDSRQHFEAGGWNEADRPAVPVDNSTKTDTTIPTQTDVEKANPQNAGVTSIESLDPKIAALYQSELGRDPDPAGAQYWQNALKSGMSLAQIKYNIDQSRESQLRQGNVDALKGTPLTYDASKFQTPQGPVRNQYGSYGGADFTQAPQASGKGPAPMQQNYGYQQPIMNGYQQPMMGGYGYGNTYGGGLGGGYGYQQPMYQQPMMSGYGMPNFGSSAQYYGAPDYAGAMQYGGMQYRMANPYGAYGMPPQMGGGYGMPQYGGYQQQYQQPQQQMPTAGGKGPSTPAPTPAPTTPPTAGGKGPSTSTPTTSTPPTAGGKGPTSSGGAFARGGRTGYSVGGADPSALKNYIDMMSNNPSVMALAAQQKAGYAGMPGNPAAMPGPYGVALNPAQPRNLMTANAQLGPQQTAMGTINQAAQFGNSVSSLATGGEKLYDKLQNWGKVKDDIGYRSPNAGNIDPLTKNEYPDVTTEAHGGRIGRNTGGRAHHALDGSVLPYGASNDPNDPSKDPYRLGYMGQLDLSQKINPTQAFNAMKNGQMPTVQETQNPLLSTATTAKNVYDFGKTANAAYDKVAGLLGSNAPTPAGGLASAYPAAPAGTPVPLARPEGLGALTSAPSTATTGAAADAAGKTALASNASPTGLAAAKAAEGSITTSTPALGELMGVGTTAETGTATATSLAALGSDASLLGAGLVDAGVVAGGAESALEFLPLLFANRGGRIGKAGGGGLGAPSNVINQNDPKYHAMKVSFNNLVHKYDNPLLAAAAMNAGTQTVDNAIRQAAHTGKEISDFLPKETVTYMYLLTQAALGAHSKLKQRVARKSGGRTGYAEHGYVSPSDAEGTTDTLSTPEQTGDQNVQLASASTDYRDYLIGKGYSPAAASGIIGNAYHESGGLNSTIKGDSGNSFGLFQFNQQGEQPAFKKWVADNKRDATDPYAQLDFVDQRLRNNYSDTFDKLQNAKDPSEAAKHFMLGYERPKEGPTQQLNARMQYANKIAAGEDLPTNTKDYGDQAPATGGGLNAKKGPFEKIADTVGVPDVVPREASFWVPLIAGLGGMLASNQYRFSQRLGEGLLAGAGAYGAQQDKEARQQQLAQQAAQQGQLLDIKRQELGIQSQAKGIEALKFLQSRYSEIRDINNNLVGYRDTLGGKDISVPEYQNAMKQAGSMLQNTPANVLLPQGGTGAAQPSGGATAQPSTTQQSGAPTVDQKQPSPTTVEPVSGAAPVKDMNDPAEIQSRIDWLSSQIASYGNSNPNLAKIREAELTKLQNHLGELAKLNPAFVQSEAAKAANIENAKSNVKYFDDQAAADQARQQTRVQLNAIKTILENFQPGTFAQEKGNIVGALNAIGISVPSTATANAAAFEEFTKEMMKNVFSSVKEIGGGLRVAELTGLERASANPTLQPEANHKIVAQGFGILDAADKRYADEVNQYSQHGPNFQRPKFQLDWRQNPENNPQKFIDQHSKNIAVRGEAPTDPKDFQEGQAYIVEPNATNGFQKPQKLRFMGINPDNGNMRWQKVQ